LPHWLKAQYPQIIKNLITNKNRLTTPYDLHMTLKHIIEISGRAENLPQALSCPKAQSLFEVVPWNRSCADACLDFHWCTCVTYRTIDNNDTIFLAAVNFVVDFINKELDTKALKDDKPLCEFLKFQGVTLAEKSKDTFEINTENEHVYYQVKFWVVPSRGTFEATIKHYTKKSEFEISGQISRIDEYGKQSECVSDSTLKKYCYCNDFVDLKLKTVDDFTTEANSDEDE
jgi:hypothetical protein